MNIIIYTGIIFLLIVGFITFKKSKASRDTNDAEVIAVISAAASEFFNEPVTINKIQFLSDQQSTAWGVAGRINIMASHLIVKRK